MIALSSTEDRKQFEQLRSASISSGAGKMRYAAAMYFYQKEAITDIVLEIYRALAKDDQTSPLDIITALNRQNEIEEEHKS
jgi:uncharacterized protein YutE (UPF0331/DUF86 family)